MLNKRQMSDTDALNIALQTVRNPQNTPKSHMHLRPLSKQRTEGGGGMVEMLEKMSGAGNAARIELASIKESPYQTSPMSEERVAALVENLKHNPLSTPVVLRKMDDGGHYETIAGHHRIEAYKRLGRLEIEATICDITEDEAERLVFYDNLFAPSLTDYQKYLGFAARRESKGLTMSELADEAGVARSKVVEMMAFEKLPNSVHKAMQKCPRAIGANLAPAFVELATKHPDLAVQAVDKIAAGEMTQKAALAWLKAGGVEAKPAISKPQKYPVWSSRKKYAEVVHSGNKLSVVLPDAAVADAVLKPLLAMIEEHAKKAKEASEAT